MKLSDETNHHSATTTPLSLNLEPAVKTERTEEQEAEVAATLAMFCHTSSASAAAATNTASTTDDARLPSPPHSTLGPSFNSHEHHHHYNHSTSHSTTSRLHSHPAHETHLHPSTIPPYQIQTQLYHQEAPPHHYMNQPLPPSNHNTQQAHQIHHHQQHHLPTTHQPAYPRTTVPDRRPQLFLTPPTTGCLRTTKPQQAVLHAEFAANPNPPGPKQQEIADRIGMKKSTVRNWFQNARSKARKAAEALANPHLQQEYQQGGDSGSEVGSNVGSTLSFADSSVLGSSQVSMNVGPSFVGQPMQQQQQQVYYSQNHVQQATQPQPVEREARSVNVMSISALI